MNVLMFVLLTMSILLTLTGARENRRRIIVGGSWTYAMSLLTALGDILIRLSNGDSSGVLDIYPSLLWVYLAVAVLIGLVVWVKLEK